MTPIIWAVVLFVSALALVALELFLPSGGILGVLAVASIIGSLVFVIIAKGAVAGAVYLVFLAIFVPFLVVAALNYWPHTSVGRRMLNVSPDGNDEPPIEPRYAHLVGKHGVAKTKMLPSGAIVIEGRSYDAVAEGAGVEPGDPVEVVRADGTRIIVREIHGMTDAQMAQGEPRTEDLQSRPASDMISDPFEDPLV